MPATEPLTIEVQTPAGTFPSFTAAAEAGYPVACEAFALCDRPADVALTHPVLDIYPACNRCADKLARLA